MIYFLITCALNTPYGVFSSEQRQQQIAQTVDSIKKSVENSKIIILEGSPSKINDQQEKFLSGISDKLFVFSDDVHLQQCYRRWNNEPIHKNIGETYCLSQALKSLTFDEDDIIVKLSGRYCLSNDFDLNFVKNKITLAGPYESVWPKDMCEIPFWYVSRYVCWGGENRDLMRSAYLDMHNVILDHVGHGKYTDVEHCLYHCIPDILIEKIPHGNLRIEGQLAATGEVIKD